MLRDTTLLFNVNRNKRLAVCILQLRQPSDSLSNLNQEMAELLKKIVLFFLCEDEGSTPVFKPRTQTCMVDLLITELGVRRALDCLNPH